MIRVHVLVSGTVQGVWYRESTRAEAERLGVRGWVRNLVDGRVEAVFEGNDVVVDELVRWCYQGPPAAAVTGVETQEIEPDGDLLGFRVLH